MVLLEFNPLILFILGYAAMAIAGVFLIAWIFSVVFQTRKLMKQQQIQTELMIKVAEKQGVSPDEISGIINQAYPERQPVAAN